MRGDGNPATYNEAVYQVVHRSPISPKEIADRLGIGPSTLYNAANPDMDEPQLCHKHIIPITNLTHNFAILDYYEHACGRVAFEVPRVNGSISQVSKETAAVVREFGHLLEQISLALQNDGKIDSTELPSIKLECLHAIQAIAKLSMAAKEEAESK